MKRSKRSKPLWASTFTLLIIVPLTLVTLAQINPQPEKPILESSLLEETKVEGNSNLGWFSLLSLTALVSLFSLAARNDKKQEPVHNYEIEEENYWG